MLATLASDIAEHGGQPISVEPLPPAAPAVPAAAAASGEQAAAPDAVPGLRAADDGVPAAVPPVTVLPVPAAQPAVHVAPIPAEPAPAPGPDDTSTAALTIIDAKKD